MANTKKSCPTYAACNLYLSNGHCNGSWYIDMNLVDLLVSGPHARKSLKISCVTIILSDKLFPFGMQQFPIQVCFQMTANKTQGQTLSQISNYIKSDFFSHGQRYVAMSRVGNQWEAVNHQQNVKQEGQ